MDISKPNNFNSQEALTPVVLIHGGGFTGGTRNEEPAWTQFYNDRGYVVFDVDYRLATATYHTWDKAAPDIATAIVWIGNHAADYHVDMSKLIIAGASAGGGLALRVAYGIQDGTLKAYEPGLLAQAKAVVAIFPAQDMTAIWNSTTSFLVLTITKLARSILEDPRKNIRRLMPRSMSRITLPGTALQPLLSPANMITRYLMRVKCNSSMT